VSVSRITITLPEGLVERIDRLERNRSRFIADAVERELGRRVRAELRRSLEAPHPESVELADQGLAAYRDALPAESPDLIAPNVGVRIVWSEGAGWSPEGEP
jgi:hypothetical protein